MTRLAYTNVHFKFLAKFFDFFRKNMFSCELIFLNNNLLGRMCNKLWVFIFWFFFILFTYTDFIIKQLVYRSFYLHIYMLFWVSKLGLFPPSVKLLYSCSHWRTFQKRTHHMLVEIRSVLFVSPVLVTRWNYLHHLQKENRWLSLRVFCWRYHNRF